MSFYSAMAPLVESGVANRPIFVRYGVFLQRPPSSMPIQYMPGQRSLGETAPPSRSALALSTLMASLLLAGLLRVSVEAHVHSSLAHVKGEEDADATEVALATSANLVVRDIRLVREHARREFAARQPGHL